jgi:hypothetical protein
MVARLLRDRVNSKRGISLGAVVRLGALERKEMVDRATDPRPYERRQ